jgi:hypothetical protein
MAEVYRKCVEAMLILHEKSAHGGLISHDIRFTSVGDFHHCKMFWLGVS